MFKAKPDPQKLVEDLAAEMAIKLEAIRDQAHEDRERFKVQAAQIAALEGKVFKLNEDLGAVEEKLDEVLKAQDVASRSIPNEKAAPEPANIMPGHRSWSTRKREREQASRSSNFIDKVKKGVTPAPKMEDASE